MTAPNPFEVIAETIKTASPLELPALVGRLVELEETARLRLRVEANGNGHQDTHVPAGVMLTPKEAASIAKVPVKRIYEWARKERWASRPTRRCLRIEHTGFRRWLAEQR